MNNSLSELSEFLKAHDRYTIIAHLAPDGDTLGSSAALYGILLQMQKTVQIVCENKAPAVYSFLPFIDRLKSAEDADVYPFAIAVDCADKSRLGKCAGLYDSAEKTVNIDHHKTNIHFADFNYVDPRVAATGEIILKLSKLLPFELDKDIAACLYTAIMTDTGNFAYSNTKPETFIAVAELLKKEIDIFHINQKVYKSVSFAKSKLIGVTLSKMELLHSGAIGIAAITKKDMNACGASDEDTEGIIDYIRDVNTVEIAILIRETDKDVCKVSLRSKNYVDVSIIAVRFNGGGHFGASGYTANKSLSETYKEIIECAGSLVSR